MLGEPAVWDALMEALVAIVLPHLRAQVDAGAQALQVFDSWVGALGSGRVRAIGGSAPCGGLFDGVADRRRPDDPLRRGGPGELLALMRHAGRRRDRRGLAHLRSTWRGSASGPDTAVQGNLDPAC
jgi:uroporphyrinogen decarboxylase